MSKPKLELSSEEYAEHCSKYIPKGVWAFWALVGAVILSWLLSRYTTFRQVTPVLINLGSSVGALVAAYATLRTVREMQAARLEERQNRKPYFSFLSGKMGISIYDDEDTSTCNFIDLEFKQVGVNPAADLVAGVILLRDYDYEVRSYGLKYDAVNEIAAGFPFEFKTSGFWLDDFQHHYVVVHLKYEDAITRQRFEQPFYFQWGGLEPGETESHIYEITRGAIPLVRGLLSQVRKQEE